MRLVAKPQVWEGGVWQPSSRPQVARREWRNSSRRKISRTSRVLNRESVGSCIRRDSNSSKVRSSASSLYKFATSPVPGGGEILATNAANRSGIEIKSSIGSVLSPRNGATRGDCYHELPRIPLPRTRVNKGKRGPLLVQPTAKGR